MYIMARYLQFTKYLYRFVEMLVFILCGNEGIKTYSGPECRSGMAAVL